MNALDRLFFKFKKIGTERKHFKLLFKTKLLYSLQDVPVSISIYFIASCSYCIFFLNLVSFVAILKETFET